MATFALLKTMSGVPGKLDTFVEYRFLSAASARRNSSSGNVASRRVRRFACDAAAEDGLKETNLS